MRGNRTKSGHGRRINEGGKKRGSCEMKEYGKTDQETHDKGRKTEGGKMTNKGSNGRKGRRKYEPGNMREEREERQRRIQSLQLRKGSDKGK